ncbi:hypothetical protein BCV72DRAFT_243979 [Rhizopus microsporus var. microsporus]|uniref:MULE transposase domain-containing protein n=1 Tax=Rhizopus microsporus var. microsporus TaxID=86635 RepID=A0A1X0QW18_RHIZD|nr:hypothetical protein BCV72DRAFT_243979 [Rhizopus microsporus var. microsporus]
MYENGPFFVAWAAKWQMKETEGWCIDLTYRTCKSFNGPKKDGYLFIVVWLAWLKDNFSLELKRIMVGCSPTEVAAIREVFSNVDILLCYWHIKRAWRTYNKRVCNA